MRSVRSSQSPPPRSTFIVWFSETLLVAAAAPAAAPAITVSAAWMPLSRSRPPRVGGLGGSSPSLRRAWPGSVPPSSLSGRKDGLVNSLGGRGKGTPSYPSSAVSNAAAGFSVVWGSGVSLTGSGALG